MVYDIDDKNQLTNIVIPVNQFASPTHLLDNKDF